MPCVSPDFHQKSFRIRHDDVKLFDKFLSRDSSKSNPSLRVLYYGDVSGAVPFVWETCPGTPKHTTFPHNLISIPPLTPPPCYYTRNSNNYSKKKKKCSGSRLVLHALLRRMNPNKRNSHMTTSTLSSLSKSSSANSWFSDSGRAPVLHKPRRLLSWVF